MNKGWSFNKNDWEKLPSQIRNSNWKKIKFTSSEVGLVKSRPGVYMFVASVPGKSTNIFSKLMVPIYIGLSNNINRRLKEHLGIKGDGHQELLNASRCFGNKMDFYYTFFEDESNLKVIEQLLFNCFGPTVNKINSVKEGKPLKASFGEEEKL